MNEFLGWVILLLLAQWFFGNLYEAVAFVPNLMFIFQLTNKSGEALFRSKLRSPVAYYVPTGAFVVPIAAISAIISVRDHAPGTAFIVASCILFFVGIGITVYMVRTINLELFFKPQADLNRTKDLLHTWTVLNYVRLFVAASSLVAAILWIRADLCR